MTAEDAIFFPDLFVNASLGMMFALCASERLRVDGAFALPVIWLVLMFVGMVRLPMTLYLYWVHPAWSWHYLFDPARLPSAVVLLVALGQCLLILGAWYLGAFLLQSRGRRVLMYVLAGSAAAAAVTIAVLGGRLATYGSYEAFTDGNMAGLLEVKLGYVLIPLVLGLGTAAALVAVELMRDARRVRVL